MLNLNDKNLHYIIITANLSTKGKESNDTRNSLLEDSLYRRNYRVIKLSSIHEDVEVVSFLAFKDILPVLNDEIRYDAIELIDQFQQDSVIVKYLTESNATKVCKSGEEIPMGLVNYDDGINNTSYFYEGNVFTFNVNKRYYTPSKKTDFKVGMIIEYLNDNKIWVEKEILNPEQEYNNMYKLLIKYNRIRLSK